MPRAARDPRMAQDLVDAAPGHHVAGQEQPEVCAHRRRLASGLRSCASGRVFSTSSAPSQPRRAWPMPQLRGWSKSRTPCASESIADQHALVARQPAVRVEQVEPVGMRVELQEAAAGARLAHHAQHVDVVGRARRRSAGPSGARASSGKGSPARAGCARVCFARGSSNGRMHRADHEVAVGAAPRRAGRGARPRGCRPRCPSAP